MLAFMSSVNGRGGGARAAAQPARVQGRHSWNGCEAVDVEALAAAVARHLRVARPAPAGALLDAQQAAALLGVPPNWLLAQARADRVPHVRLGRYVRFDADKLGRWADGRMRGPRPPDRLGRGTAPGGGGGPPGDPRPGAGAGAG